MSTGCSLRCVIRAAWPVQKDERDESRLIPDRTKVVTPVLHHRTYFTTQRGNPMWTNDNTHIHVLGEATSPLRDSITGSILITS